MGEAPVQHGMHCTMRIQPMRVIATMKGPPASWRLMKITCGRANLHTQALFVPTVLAGYASMVTHHILDASLLVHHGSEHQLPAQVWLLHHSRAAAAQRCSAICASGDYIIVGRVLQLQV